MIELRHFSRETLLKPLQAVVGIVERKQTMPILGNVLIEAREKDLIITASDLEIEISAKVSEAVQGEAGEITVGARKLLDLLKALPDQSSLNMTLPQPGKMQLQAGRSRYQLQTLSAQDFPRSKVVDQPHHTLTLLQKDLRRLLVLTKFAMGQQDVRFYLNGVQLLAEDDQLRAVATDGHRLSLAAQTVSPSPQRYDVILPRKTVDELVRLLQDSDSTVQLEWLGSQIRFSFDEITLLSKVIDGKFPDYRRAIPQGLLKYADIDRTLFIQTLQRAAILANEKFRGVRVNFNPHLMKLACTNLDQEEAEEELEMNYEGTPVEIGFNINYILDILQQLDCERIRFNFNDAGSSAVIYPLVDESIEQQQNYRYVIMPMRI
jgi:DNA polymerase III subunit beta